MTRLALAVLVCLSLAAPARAAGPAPPCTGDPSVIERLDLTVGGTPTYGTYTLPRGTPRGLVVFGHGYSYNVDAWRDHMRAASARDGLVAVTMDYRGLTDLPADASGYQRSRGFPVKPGGEDLVAAAQNLDAICGGFPRRLLLGVSMGGNASGLGAAIGAKTADGRPIFDYWIGVEGVYNFTEEYTAARAAGATAAVEDFEKEAGGSLEQKPDAYAERTVVNRSADIARSGIRGVALVHGANDGLVPYDQANQMARALRRDGMPTDFYTAVRKAPGDQQDDTRLAPADDRPGHASEWAQHVVIDTGLSIMSAIARGDRPPPCNRDFTVDGSASPPVSPDPAQPAAGCPAAPTFAGTSRGDGGGAGSGGGPGPIVSDPASCAAAAIGLRARAARGTLRLAGTARVRDAFCRSGVRRVRLTIARRGRGGMCRMLAAPAPGRLTRSRPCSGRRVFLRPRGTSRFRLTARHLRPGRYRVTVIVRGRNGVRTARARTVRLR